MAGSTRVSGLPSSAPSPAARSPAAEKAPRSVRPASRAGYAVLALLLSLLQTAPERVTLLARLRTMGMTRRQGRRLLVLESLPQGLLAAAGGTLVGWATIALLAPGVDLTELAVAAVPGTGTIGEATLRADPSSYAMLDRAGRLQLPAEYTEALGMEHRVMLELEQDHLSVWPDDTGAGAGD
jgi:putative ABC transport system permease protein